MSDQPAVVGTPKQYRKKPVAITASQWFKYGDHPAVVAVPYDHPIDTHAIAPGEWGWINDLEGGHLVQPSDWIITGVRGEHYAIKADIFAETYELVGTSQDDEVCRCDDPRPLASGAKCRRCHKWTVARVNTDGSLATIPSRQPVGTPREAIAHQFACKEHGSFTVVSDRSCPVNGSCPTCDANPVFNSDIDAGPYGMLGGVIQKCQCGTPREAEDSITTGALLDLLGEAARLLDDGDSAPTEALRCVYREAVHEAMNRVGSRATRRGGEMTSHIVSAERLRELQQHANDNADLRAELAQIRAQLNGYQEREAALCPEDVGIDEWCATMKKRAEAAQTAYAALLRDLRDIGEEWEQFAVESFYTLRADALRQCRMALMARLAREPRQDETP